VRLTRYWVFIIVAYLIAIGLLVIKSIWHTMGSSVSASVGMLAPRYNIAESGLYYVIVFLIGIIFLAFDVRARDTRERVQEILDSRNYSNLDLVLGRFLGMFLSAWIPVVLLVLLIQLLGWLLPLLGSPFGRTIEPYSLFSFPFFIALPAMAFGCALVMVITLLVRQRFVALILSAATLIGLYSLSVGQLPYSVSSSLDLMGFFQTNIPSDLIPSVALNFSGWVQRLGIIVFTISLLFFAALVHPRLDGSNRVKQTVIACASGVLGIALIVTVFQVRNQELNVVDSWRLAHKQKNQQMIPDIVLIKGSVDIKPGKVLNLDLELNFKAPPGNHLQNALFSLNPGFTIEKITDPEGNILPTQFSDGLLEVQLARPLQSGEQTSIRLQFSGSPNLQFAYLDSAINPRALSDRDANVALLGFDNAIFDRKYVALMPGIHWLPASGSDVGRDDNRTRPKDFFKLNLSVKLPANWLAAGPGLRVEKQRNDNFVEYQFMPKSAIAEVPLMAAPFKSYATKIDNIVFELLIHPEHDSSIEVLAPGKEQIKIWIADKLSLLRSSGLEYPFDAFTLVEVPNTLRGYTGGWRTDTALAPPSMVLMKESGLPTARFDFDATETFGKGRGLKDQKDGAGIILNNRLMEFFNNDFTGGNVFTGIARSFFSHQISAIGDEALALDYTLEQLVTLVLTEQQGFFSPTRMFDVLQSMGRTIGSDPQRGKRVSERVMNSFTSDLDVWDNVMVSPLSNIDPWDDPRLTIDLLALKGGGLAKVIYDILGPDKSAQVIAQLLSNHRGATYSRADLVVAIDEQDSELGQLIDNWYITTGLAGFTSDQSELYQLVSSENGNSQYQLKIRINNEEPVTGYVRVAWTIEAGQQKTFSKPLRISGNSSVEYGVILTQPPQEVFIEPYLSLNRSGFLVKTFIASDITTENRPAVRGVSEVTLDNHKNNPIVIDDLDSRFSISHVGDKEGFRLTGKTWRRLTDQGLPISNGWKPTQWSRRSAKSAWGKYRHTLAFIRPGNGESKAVLETIIPEAGHWELRIHLPNITPVRQKRLGNLELEIVFGEIRKPIVYNAKESIIGWNIVGEYELAAGDVRVEISNKTDGEIVIADAVSWIRVNKL